MRGLQVLECFGERDRDRGLSLTEIASRTGIDTATVLRLLTTYCVAGYLRRDETTNLYSLTARILRLSQGITWYQVLIEVARPHLTDLRDHVSEVVHLGVIEDNRVVYIDKLEAAQSVKLVSAVGQIMPLNTTALGKALLAARVASGGESLADYKEGFESRTARSLTSDKRLGDELKRTAERGYSIDDMENEDGVLCVGAPIFNRSGVAIAALSVSGPEYRMRQHIEDVGARCSKVAEQIGAELRAY